jgi:hypothetical protein
MESRPKETPGPMRSLHKAGPAGTQLRFEWSSAPGLEDRRARRGLAGGRQKTIGSESVDFTA